MQPGENPNMGTTVWSTAMPTTAGNCAPFKKEAPGRGDMTLEHQLCTYLNGPRRSRACGTHRVTKLNGGAAVHYKKELETRVEAE